MGSLPPSGGLSGEDNVAVSTKVQWAVDRLKLKFPESISYDELFSFCWAGTSRPTPAQVTFWDFWTQSRQSKIDYDPKNRTYKFKPLHNIASPEDLVKFLQTQPTANGLPVKDLKDGWPQAEESIDILESEHKILVHRNKKDGHARTVWADNPKLYSPLDAEFRDMWFKIPLPSPQDTIKELAKIGYKPAGTAKDPKKAVATTVAKKIRKSRGFKQTNTHMAHLFKDFSGKRAQAGK